MPHIINLFQEVQNHNPLINPREIPMPTLSEIERNLSRNSPKTSVLPLLSYWNKYFVGISQKLGRDIRKPIMLSTLTAHLRNQRERHNYEQQLYFAGLAQWREGPVEEKQMSARAEAVQAVQVVGEKRKRSYVEDWLSGVLLDNMAERVEKHIVKERQRRAARQNTHEDGVTEAVNLLSVSGRKRRKKEDT